MEWNVADFTVALLLPKMEHIIIPLRIELTISLCGLHKGIISFSA